MTKIKTIPIYNYFWKHHVVNVAVAIPVSQSVPISHLSHHTKCLFIDHSLFLYNCPPLFCNRRLCYPPLSGFLAHSMANCIMQNIICITILFLFFYFIIMCLLQYFIITNCTLEFYLSRIFLFFMVHFIYKYFNYGWLNTFISCSNTQYVWLKFHLHENKSFGTWQQQQNN